ncbi:MAG: protein-L-isoaspartate O-methyltransferase [bacterium]
MKNPFNIDDYGSSNEFQWTHEYLIKILTTGKKPILTSLYLKNAFRNIRREDFIPQGHKAKAYQDMDIDIGHGETMDKPTVIAQMLELLKPKIGGTFLDIGTGSGWVTALLAYAAGKEGKVYSIERLQLMVDIARSNLKQYPNITNAVILFGDGSKGLAAYAPYNGIHVSAAFEKIPEILINQLKIGGKLVAPTLENDIRLIERESESAFKETIHKGYFFKRISEGVV